MSDKVGVSEGSVGVDAAKDTTGRSQVVAI